MAAGNPQVPLGSLNKLRGSCSWTQQPSLNVSASYLGPNGIRWRPLGPATDYHATLVGGVPSPNAFQILEFVLPLLKTQGLGALYKAQFETNSFMGDATLRSDASPFPDYQVGNCSIITFDELAMDGSTPVFAVHCQGFYQVNNQLWDLV